MTVKEFVQRCFEAKFELQIMGSSRLVALNKHTSFDLLNKYGHCEVISFKIVTPLTGKPILRLLLDCRVK